MTSGEIVQTPAGFTHLETTGEGPPMVLIHGMTSPMLVFDRLAPRMAVAGHRVVRFDLIGRGLSERPPIPHTLERYLEQLEGVLDAVDAQGPVTLVGYSWGAGLAASWAAANPTRVTKLVLMAPGGLTGPYGCSFALLRAPLLGEAIVALAGRRALRSDVQRMFTDPQKHLAYLDRFEAQFDHAHYGRSFLSTLRCCPLSWEPAYAALATKDVAVDVLWGTEDAKVPHTLWNRLATLVPQARLHLVQGGSHGMPWEEPDATAKTLLEAAIS